MRLKYGIPSQVNQVNFHVFYHSYTILSNFLHLSSPKRKRSYHADAQGIFITKVSSTKPFPSASVWGLLQCEVVRFSRIALI